jgi:lysozyme family protein
LWWLIGAIVLAVAVVSTFLIRRNNRKQAWADRLSSSEADVAWFARELIPHLSQAPSVQQMAGGWRISSDRVIAAEDRLTSLEAAAIDDVGRGQARTLRDAVREARARLDALAVVGDMATALSQLQGAAGELEAALASVSPATQGATRDNPPQR